MNMIYMRNCVTECHYKIDDSFVMSTIAKSPRTASTCVYRGLALYATISCKLRGVIVSLR